MSVGNSLEESHRARSIFVRGLVHHACSPRISSAVFTKRPPKKIVQFWDDLDRLPNDVSACIETWSRIGVRGFERMLFDKHEAKDFIRRYLGFRHERAFEKCYHPAMQSDYFRLCYILVEGGCYVDVDDIYDGCQIEHLFSDGRLKLQPLCYDMATSLMVPPTAFVKPGSNTASWIFYFNNNPLIAGSGHPLIKRALMEATLNLERDTSGGLPEIQSTTGPGNLTKSIFEAAKEDHDVEHSLLVLSDWENTARTKWELSYRNDLRNWRLSNCRCYKS